MSSVAPIFPDSVTPPDFYFLCADLGLSQAFVDQSYVRIEQLLQKHSPAEVAYILEESLGLENPNKDGTFYTPPTLALYLMSRIKAQVEAGLQYPDDFSVLDPACGTGVFLCTLLETLNHLRTQKSDLISSQALIKNCLFGVDRNPKAVALCRLLIAAVSSNSVNTNSPPFDTAAVLKAIKKNIRLGDFLTDTSPPQRFSVILGNPPYGLSRDEQISKTENDTLKRAYAQYRSGKVNKYLLFMAQGFLMLRPHGVMSYIVPNAWLGITAGEAIRKLFLQQAALTELNVLSGQAFPGIGVEPVIFQLRREISSSPITIRHVDSQTYAEEKSTSVPLATCLNLPGAIIPLQWSASIDSLLSDIRSRTRAIDDNDSPYNPLIALQAYSVGKGTPPQSRDDVKNHVFHAIEAYDGSCIPYLEGKDISRYSIRWSGTYLRYGPWLAEPQKLSRFEGPRVVVREVLGKNPYALIAAYVEGQFLYNKSVLHILPRDTVPSKLKKPTMMALMCILNSRLATFLIRVLGRKSQRSLFPKVVNADLKSFLIPLSLQQAIERLAPYFHCLGTRMEPKAQQQIDAIVYSAYGLRAKDVQLIESEMT